MSQRTNEFEQPLGAEVPGWTPRPRPPRTTMPGRFCRLEPLEPRHAADLHEAYRDAPDWRDWTYLPVHPMPELADYCAWVATAARSDDPLHHAIIDLGTGKPVGTAAYLRIDPGNGAIEVGNITYSPRLQRRPAGTEAMYLMMRRAFDELGYRRYEWKCDSHNAPSRAAALRYGCVFEGIFRQAVVTKGRSRDTAWFAIIDGDWPACRAALEAWLAPENFSPDGRQLRSLSDLRAILGGAAAPPP